MCWRVAVLLALLTMAASKPHFKEEPKCGYESCPVAEPDYLNVHIVAHTHDDVGWLKTLDQYYYGSRNNIQQAGVQYIIDSVIDELWKDKSRRFIYVETAFFWKWWMKQDDSIRHKVHVLVREGRLEFIGGAWSMNDEAATHYRSTIDQFTWGLRKLNDTFGECGRPRVGWQIDPFGHSREFANTLANMGYDGLFLGRIDYQDKAQRLADKNMELLWRGNDDLGSVSDMFTGVLYNTYSPPPGFCFDVLCSDEPIIDDPHSPMYNVPSKVGTFLDYVDNITRGYETKNALVTMGGDFTYQDAHMWYRNLDLLIQHTNKMAAQHGKRVKLFYSTPSCYLKAVHDAKPRLPTKRDDFFPYASDPHAYWTGYFTSRPNSKYFERCGNAYLQMVKQLQVLANLEEHNMFLIDELRSAMGMMQHHDAVTGTEKQHVADDYHRILHAAIHDALVVATQAIRKLSQPDPEKPIELEFVTCQLNISECRVSENSDQFVVSVYNPLGWQRHDILRLPVLQQHYTVYDHLGGEVECEVVPLPASVLDVRSRSSAARHELACSVSAPPLGYTNYYVRAHNTQHTHRRAARHIDLDEIKQLLETEHGLPFYRHNYSVQQPATQVPDAEQGDDPYTVQVYPDDDYIENEYLKLSVDKATGRLTSLVVKSDGARVSLDVDMRYYPGCVGNNTRPELRASGAYIFRPNSTDALSMGPRRTTRIVKGSLVQEIHQQYSEYASAVLRLHARSQLLEVEWLVGPIPVDDQVGKEVVIVYDTDLRNERVFYTDSNGRQTVRRVLDERPQYRVELRERVAGNYYPVNSKIHVEDASGRRRFSVLTDRAHGASALRDGRIEVLLHRRLLHDDAFGVGEALNETAAGRGVVARGKHFVSFGAPDAELKRREKEEAARVLQPLEPLLADAARLDLDRFASMNNSRSGLASSLPRGAHLVTLEPWRPREALVRLENMFEKSDLDGEAGAVTVDLETLFASVRFESVRETSLAADRWSGERRHFEWDTRDRFDGDRHDTTAEGTREGDATKDFKIKLNPSEIRTFVVELVPKPE